MTEQNGFKIYDKGEKPQLPAGLGADSKVISPFGFKIFTVDGKSMLQVATEDDYCKSEATRLGVSEDEVRSRARSRGPNDCHSVWPGNLVCQGQCPLGGECVSIQNGNTGLYYCACRI